VTRGSPSPSRKPSSHRARARLAGGSSHSASSRNSTSRSPRRRPPAKPSDTGCAAPTRTSRNAPISTPASPPGSTASHCHNHTRSCTADGSTNRRESREGRPGGLRGAGRAAIGNVPETGTIRTACSREPRSLSSAEFRC
jgi:hypothetical protein